MLPWKKKESGWEPAAQWEMNCHAQGTAGGLCAVVLFLTGQQLSDSSHDGLSDVIWWLGVVSETA